MTSKSTIPAISNTNPRATRTAADGYGQISKQTEAKSNLTAQKNKAPLDSVDLAKFFLSILIVCIHVRPLDHAFPFFEPILRIAVPLFFLFTSYFFFRKHLTIETAEERISNIKRFAKRNAQLYLFWFIATLIPTVMYRNYFHKGIAFGFFKIIHEIPLGSTFLASWYISASVIAVIVIVASTHCIGPRKTLIWTSVVFVICCLMSNYINIVPDGLAAGLRIDFSYCYNNFWVALFWVALGRILAEWNPNTKPIYTVGLSILGLLALEAEQYLITMMQTGRATDCFFLLPFACIPIFLTIINARIKLPGNMAKSMRAASTVTYCLHGTLLVVARMTIQGWESIRPELFSTIIIITWIATALILLLEKKKGAHWLRYAH